MTIPDDVFEGIWICQRVWQAGGKWHAMYRSTVDDSMTFSHYIASGDNLPIVGQPFRLALRADGAIP